MASRFARPPVRQALASALTALGLLVVGEVGLTVLPVRVTLEIHGSLGQVTMDGGQHLVMVTGLGPGAHIQFEQPGPAQREYQVDGSDTTARHDRNPAQFDAAQGSAWYGVLAWLRDEGSYSRWDDAQLVDLADGHLVARGTAAVEATPLPTAFRLEAALRRPEAPARIWLAADGAPNAGLSIERDNHRVRWLTGPDADEAVMWFFPIDPWPFAAELLHLVGRSAATGLGLLTVMAALSLAAQWAGRRVDAPWMRRPAPPGWAIGSAVLGLWLTAAVWISVRVYHQLPHVVDAEAYYFQARILETGRTWLHAPDIVHLLDGFQQIVWNDRWFSQYPPGAPAVYAAGGLLGMAWLVGPLAGLILVGATALAGRLLFGRFVAIVALVLGALSPFVLFQAGSFMSHPIAGAAVACSLAAFAYGWRTGRPAWFGGVGVLLGITLDSREIAALLYGLVYGAWLLTHGRWRAVAWVALGSAPFVGLYLLYNLSTTGNALMLPRNLFNDNDRWGFGLVGSYGQHTLAAGLVNTDENLTLLQFDLFGSPPLVAFALLGLPFLLGQATRREYFAAACASAFVIAYVGYFYHGISLGPRYYFEAVPALVLLAARGIQASVQTLCGLGLNWWAARAGGCALVILLGMWTFVYYLPHAVDRRMDYGALSNGRRLVLPFIEPTLTGAHLARVEPPALVLVPNDDVFKALSALNCPLLDQEHIGACPTLLVRTGVGDAPRLLERFPGRSVWLIDAHGDLVTLDRVRPSTSRQ